MKLYELIIALNPALSTEDSKELTDKVEGLFPWGIKQKDDIGYQTIHNVHGLKKGSQAYFISYLVEADHLQLPELQQKMSLYKGLLRRVFLSHDPKDPFVIFQDIKDIYTEKLLQLASKDKKAKKTRDQKQQLLDTAKETEIEIVEEDEEEAGAE